MNGNEQAYKPWGISPAGFPGHEAAVADRLRFLVGYALLAPSGYNRQPWWFRVTGGVVEFHADRTRCLPVIDHDDRELTIGCGSALFNVRVAARNFGYTPVVSLLPDADDPDLLATLSLGDLKPPTHEQRLLFAAIPKRRTNRQSFERRKIDPVLTERLGAVSVEEGAWLALLAKRSERHALAELIAQGDRVQFSDKRFRRELASWVHSGRSQSHDGMPAYAQGMREIMTTAGSLPIRTFDLGKGVAASDLDLAEHSPLLGVLGTPDDEPLQWLRAGQALQHVLLLACGSGISASFMNQPVEVEMLRPRVASLVRRTGHAQVVFRLGYGPEPPLMPRRGLAEVLRGR
jgi:hypothetical protein